jgi:hypothetical protein
VEKPMTHALKIFTDLSIGEISGTPSFEEPIILFEVRQVNRSICSLLRKWNKHTFSGEEGSVWVLKAGWSGSCTHFVSAA